VVIVLNAASQQKTEQKTVKNPRGFATGDFYLVLID
jgi:hypothetical protein